MKGENKNMSHKNNLSKFKQYVEIFRILLDENILNIHFIGEKVLVGRDSNLLLKKIKEKNLEKEKYEDYEPEIMAIIRGLVFDKEYDKIISILLNNFDYKDQEEIREKILIIDDIIVNDKIKEKFLFEIKSISNKLLDYKYEINKKLLNKTEINTIHLNLTISKPQHQINRDLKLEDFNFEITVEQLKELIKFLIDIKEEINC